MKNKRQILDHLPPINPDFSICSVPVVHGGGKKGLQSAHHSCSHQSGHHQFLLPLQRRIPHTLLPLWCWVPPMGDSPPWSCPTWVLPFFLNCSTMGPSQGPSSKPIPVFPPLSIGPQVLLGIYASVGFPLCHSLPQASICSNMQMDICSPMDFHGL